jgi:uncharacterized membrane protein YhaH (DUF805 family)
MSFSESISTCLSKYATFSGRAGRSEFWWFYLFTTLMNWGATIVGYQVGVGILLSVIVCIIFFVPLWAVSSRRLHDTGRSGWWTLLVITVFGAIPVIIWWAKATPTVPQPNASSSSHSAVKVATAESSLALGPSGSRGSLGTNDKPPVENAAGSKNIDAAIDAMKKALEVSKWR